MSAYHDIYVRSVAEGTDLIGDVSELLGVGYQPHGDGDGFLLITDSAFVDVYLSHDLEDDGQLRYSAYPQVVTVRDRDRNRERAERLALSVRDGLVASGRYECFVVYNTTQLVR